MGAVNYHTSAYITLGIRPYDASDFEQADFEEEVKEYGGTLEQAISDYINTCYEDDENNAQFILDKYSFQYFRVEIKAGYYEGFTLDIESDFPEDFNSWQDKTDLLEDIANLEKLLVECAGVGLVSVYPGWVTGYRNYEETIAEIKSAIQNIRKEVEEIDFSAQYCAEAV